MDAGTESRMLQLVQTLRLTELLIEAVPQDEKLVDWLRRCGVPPTDLQHVQMAVKIVLMQLYTPERGLVPCIGMKNY